MIPPSLLNALIPDPEPRPVLQALVLRCNGVDYMFFGPPLPGPVDEVPDIDSIGFGGLVPMDHIIELLQNASRPKAPNGCPVQ